MIEFFSKLFDTTGFPARWYCGNWDDAHGWLHIISDVLIFGAYFAIPVSLLIVAWKKHRDLLFERLVLLFAMFILACGIGHLIEASIFWKPWYRLSGVSKAFTAIVSWITVFALVRHLPKALSLPGMVTINNNLQAALAREKEAIRELEGINQDLDKFAYAASHDLRAPLRSIRNLASWIEEDCRESLPDQSQRHLEQLQQRARRLDTLLEDLLAYSRAGRDLDVPGPVDLNAVVGRVFGDLGPAATHMDFRIEGPLPKVLSHEIAWEQIAGNLISNAAKHHQGPKGNLVVSSEREGAEVKVVFADDGPGIAKEHFTRIFHMFETLQSKDETEGSGIGLALVQKVVKRMGGRVDLESTPGKGSRFIVVLPAALAIPCDVA